MPRIAKPKEIPGLFQRDGKTGKVWYARFTLLHNGRKRRYLKAFGQDRQAALQWLREEPGRCRMKVEAAPVRQQKQFTVDELCIAYLAYIQDEGNVRRPRDQANPPQRIRAIREAFGHRVAASVAPYEIEDWLMSLPHSNATRNRYKGVFSAVYSYGNKRDQVDVNPVRKVEQFPVELGHPRWLLPDEEKALYAVLERWITDCPETHKYNKLLLQCHPLEIDIAISTGLRKGNQYAMRWDWIDLNTSNIHIPKTKNGSSHDVHILPRVHKALTKLRSIRKQMNSLKQDGSPSGRSSSNDLVFPIQENREWWKKALHEAGITNLRWHDLRHTTASLMVQNKVPLEFIAGTLGHSSMATTRRYAHLNNEVRAKAMEVLNTRRS